MKDLTLVDRDAVRFLERCADSIKIKNCPAYIREWITDSEALTFWLMYKQYSAV